MYEEDKSTHDISDDAIVVAAAGAFTGTVTSGLFGPHNLFNLLVAGLVVATASAGLMLMLKHFMTIHQ